MAFELWPPSYLDLRSTPPRVTSSSASAPVIPTPSSSSSSSTPTTSGTTTPTRPTAKRERDLRALLRSIPPEQRASKLQEISLARNQAVLRELTNNSPRRSSPLKQGRRPPSCKPFRRYHEGVLGCPHYQTNVAVSAPCCGEFFVCRFCHDEHQQAHRVDRRAVDRLQCMRCCHVQAFASPDDPNTTTTNNNECEQCHERFAHYFCAVCRLYDDAPGKRIFHCDECGVCRVGQREDFFHCRGCNACLGVELQQRHHCVENLLEATCPVCACGLQSSLRPITTFACGHAMHQSCYQQYSKHSYRCPCCSKSLGDTKEYFERLDGLLLGEGASGSGSAGSAATATDTSSGVLVACADCEKRSTVRAHVMYHKCGVCGSYNTKVM